MISNKQVLVLILCFTILFSCTKDESDVKSPVIIFNTPYEGAAYNVLDIITVNVDISDDKQITSVTLGLLNAQFVPVQTSVSIPFTADNEISFTRSYQLYDIRLESGDYYIWVAADDGSNISNAYQRISVTEIPKKLNALYAVTKSSSSQTGFYKIDSIYNYSFISNYACDYGGSSISSYEQLLFLSGKNFGDTKALDVETGSLKWTTPFPLGTAPYCLENYYADKTIYASYSAGTIGGYNLNGLNYFSANAVSGYYSEKLFKHNTYLLSEQKSYTTGSNKLVTYLATGFPLQEQLMAMDVVEFFKKENAKAFVFGNNASQQAVMEIFDINGNSFWSPHTMPASKLLSVEQVDSNTYLIGLDNNTIYKYTYHNNTLISYINGVKPKCIRYNYVDNEVVIADDLNVWCYDYTSAGFKNAATLSDTIYSIHLLYNR